ncbi:MAG: radical SAM protein [Planctomycetota bacterium]
MRRQYWHLIRDRARRLDPVWLARGAIRWATTPRATRRRRPIAGPVFSTLVVNYVCNLRCSFCDAWRSAGGARRGQPLDRAEWLGVVRELRRLGSLGVGISGGEPLLFEDLFPVLEAIRAEGMVAHLNTNATRLGPEEAARILAAGVESVNVSLDAPTAEAHDRGRGRDGAFDEACRGIVHLLEARGRKRAPRVSIVSVVDVDSDPEGVAKVAAELGVDALGFIPRHAFGETSGAADAASPEAARDMERRLLELKRRDPRIDNSEGYLRLFADALSARPSSLTCHTGVGHLVVDRFGDVFPCLPFNEAGRAWANVRRTPLAELWGGAEHARIIGETAACRSCYWNCHTELNLLFAGRGR